MSPSIIERIALERKACEANNVNLSMLFEVHSVDEPLLYVSLILSDSKVATP